MRTVTKYLDSGALEPSISPVYEITEPTYGISEVNPNIRPVYQITEPSNGGSSVNPNISPIYVSETTPTSPIGVSIVSPILDEEIKPLPTVSTTPTTSTTPATSTITTNPLPVLGGLPSGGIGGGALANGGGAIKEDVLGKKKKPFPYWILIVGAVGAYLIFRKK
jgi:hypothetical protein